MRIMCKDLRAIQKRVFICAACGAETPATKRKGKTNHGHIKTMWCYQCKAIRKFTQSDYCEEIRTMEERITRLEELVDSMRKQITTLKDRTAALEMEAQERQETALQVDGKELSQAIGKHAAEILESFCGSVPLTDDTGDKATTSADFDIKKEIQKQLQLLLDSEGKEHFYGEDMNIARAKLELLLKVYPYDLFSDSKDSFS